LLFLFTLYFNKDYCFKNFINYDKQNEDIQFLNGVLYDCAPMSDDLLVFFNIIEDGRNFMTKYYYDAYEDDFASGGYNLSKIQEALTDYDKVTENIIRFYFKEADEDTVNACKNDILAISNLIKSSKYAGDVKSSLYSFFIEPIAAIHKLSYELMAKDFFLSQQYEKNYSRFSDLRNDFNYDELYNGLISIKNSTQNLNDFSNIYISFCLCHKNCINLFYDDDSVIIILGWDYNNLVNSLISKTLKPEYEIFGNAISEKNRVEILDLIFEKEEITIKDIEQTLGFTGTNAYYHLSIMIRAGMIRTRNRGRTVLYRINHDYFDVLCDMLSKFSNKKGEDKI